MNSPLRGLFFVYFSPKTHPAHTAVFFSSPKGRSHRQKAGRSPNLTRCTLRIIERDNRRTPSCQTCT
jgi:hypothetical protein